MQCFHARPGLLTKIDGKKVESSKVCPWFWPLIEPIEKDNGKPVVTHTQEWTWEALHGMGLRDLIAGFGRLLRHM